MNGYIHRVGSGLFLILFCIAAYSQCPVTDFNLPVTACIGQQLQINNLSEQGEYHWDFCAGDLNNTPTAIAQYMLPAANGRPGLEFAKDGDKWFGFVTGTFTNTLYRLEFENGTNQAPTLTQNLGDLAGVLNGPGQIRILKEGNIWYGLLINTTSGDLIKLSFGDKLSNSITTSVLISGIGHINSGLAVGRDDTHGWTCVLSTSSNQFSIVRLGNSLSVPDVSDIITSSSVPNPDNLADVDIMQSCDKWYGFASNLGNGKVYRLDFGVSLFSSPAITEIASLAIANSGRLRLAQEGEEYFLFAVALEGTLTKFEFGNDLNSFPIIIDEGSIGNTLASNIYGLAVSKENSTWTVSTVSLANGQVFQINYPETCATSPSTTNEVNPKVKFTQPGQYKVTLENASSSGFSAKSRVVNISAVQAPDILLDAQNNCANHLVQFSVQNVSGDITNYSWSFGDSNTSTQTNPTHVYSIAGEYHASLSVTAANGCQNFAQETVTMYNQPTADFSLPSASPFCTNQLYNFVNTSTFDAASNPTWEWSLNGMVVSSALDLSTQFSTDQPQEIKLKSSIPGCVSEIVKNVSSVQTGPIIDFTFSNSCEDVAVSFINTTMGAIVDYTWDFDDGNTSTQQNAVNTFENAGLYQVTLQATNLSGCQNFAAKEVRVYSNPQPNFSLDLPPFSCAGSPSQFNDLTPALTDSNIISWSWSFGDAANGTSTQKNPTYIYNTAADYDVSLQVTSNFGCSNSLEKKITISSSPGAAFTTGPACLNKPTQLTDASGSDVKAWLWTVNNSSYTIKNPAHTFSTIGNQSVMLTVTGNNNCVNQTTKTVVVPVPVVADFTSASTCAGTTAVFQEITSGGVDPAVAWNWNFAGQANASTSLAQHIFPNTGNFPVTFTSTRQSGCSYSLTKSILISQPPVASFKVSTGSGAAPLTVGFTNTSSLATSFLWKFNDPNNSISTDFSPAFVFNQLGSYSVELIASNAAGCSDNFTETIQVVVPAINAVLSDFILSSTPDGGKKATVTIENKSNITLVNPEVFLDLAGNSLIREKLSVIILPGQSITRMLTVDIIPRNLTYACAEVKVLGDNYQFDNRACLNLTTEPTYLQPYPNPAQSQLFLDWINENQESLQIVIYNSSGQIAMNRKYNLLPGLNQVLVDVNNLATGIYFVSYSDGRIIQSFRFSIAR